MHQPDAADADADADSIPLARHDIEMDAITKLAVTAAVCAAAMTTVPNEINAAAVKNSPIEKLMPMMQQYSRLLK